MSSPSRRKAIALGKFLTAAAVVVMPLTATAQSIRPPALSTPVDIPGMTTVILVRHAERAGKADSLSAAGRARAKALVHVLGDCGIKAIYHSDTRRTRETAEPLAAALHIKLEEYPAKDAEALMRRIFSEGHAGEAVLVVGHSNTIPMLITAAGGPAIEDLLEDEYDRLFILIVYSPFDRPSTKLVEVKYGAPSP